MPARQAKDLRTRKILFVILLLVIAGAIAFMIYENRPWTVPDSAREMRNPIAPLAADLESIRPIYRDKCSSCHGLTGRGDGHDASLYDPKPTDFTDAKHMSAVTDGELFYKLTEGRKPMPSFKKRLSEQQRWRMVVLIRAFLAPPTVGPAGIGTAGSLSFIKISHRNVRPFCSRASQRSKCTNGWPHFRGFFAILWH